MDTFDEITIKNQLEELNDWRFVKNAIEKQFLFKDFTQALAFIVQVGILSEKRNHHPELLNVYNKVSIKLYTHTANAVTAKDIDLAKAIDGL